jgi:hypothetical protein
MTVQERAHSKFLISDSVKKLHQGDTPCAALSYAQAYSAPWVWVSVNPTPGTAVFKRLVIAGRYFASHWFDG